MRRRQAKKIIKKYNTTTTCRFHRALAVVHGGKGRDKIIDVLRNIEKVFSNLPEFKAARRVTPTDKS